MSNPYALSWLTEEYQQSKQQVYQQVLTFMQQRNLAFDRILDIGAGYAHISEQFQKNWGSQLWFIEGDFQGTGSRTASYGPVENMQYYLSHRELTEYWQSRGIDYTLIAPETLAQFSEPVKFDLVYSWISAGFHYPARVYREFIKKHSHDNTVIIIDSRRKSLTGDQQGDFDILHRFTEDPTNKKQRIQIRFR